jgi:phenylacetate-CoA ligase
VSVAGLRIALVGPLPPASGGMANQTLQLAGLLGADGAEVQLVGVNGRPCPAWLGSFRGWRAAARLPPYLAAVWKAAGAADLLHVMANSGWSWHLHAAPAIWIARLRGKPVLLNYRGGEADAFLKKSGRIACVSMRRADAIVVPSAFLSAVFAKYGLVTQIVPNVIDLARFTAPPSRAFPAVPGTPRLLVARHLEPVYDNATAVRAFALVRRQYPAARLTIAGAGAELSRLEALVGELDLRDAVRFPGAVDAAQMADLYRDCDIVLNPSRADNMPNSVLEALACERALVSTNVGGIPALLQHNVTALLVPSGDADAMAQAVLALLADPSLAQRLTGTGADFVRQFCWSQVGPRLAAQYRRILHRPRRGFMTNLVARCVFQLQEKIKGHRSASLRRALETSQWLSPIALHQLQLTRLRGLLLHAQRHVPHYRELFSRIGFDAAQLSDLADLRQLPLLLKADIGAARERFRSEMASPLTRMSTGGSSGEPLVFYLAKERVSHDIAAKWRATRWWGVDIGDREVVVWGSPIELKAQDRLRWWRDRLLRSTLLPAFHMGPKELDGFVRGVVRLRPRMLFGYPSALALIAARAQDSGIALDGLGIRVVFTTAERLYDEQRALISRVFGCPVANGYGGRDAGFIAHECPEGGMHITAEDIIVEIVDARGRALPAGESGQIVVTHLGTRDFPFVRYATGDVGALDDTPCRCGRGLPMLKRIEGRSTDFVVAQDGTVLHGLALIYILRELPQLRAFKIVQESLALTRLILVANPVLDAGARTSIERQFRARLGPAVVIAIEEVAAIPPDASGKFRYVSSKVAADGIAAAHFH